MSATRIGHDPGAPVVVFSPHLDDAVLSTWSTLTRPAEVVVVNVCDGVPPPGTTTWFDRLCGAPDSAAHVRARHIEDRAALALAGREPLGLGLLDGQYVDEPLTPEAVLDALVTHDLVASLVLAPAGIGRHPDHAAVRDAALALARDTAMPVELYAELPYAIRFGWPAWVTAAPAIPTLDVDVVYGRDLVSVPWAAEGLQRSSRRLDPDAQTAKRRAIETYVTQLATLDAGPHEMLRGEAILGFEASWTVT